MMKLWMILFQLFFQWHDANLFLSMIPGFELTDPSQLDQFIEKNLEGGRMQCSICKDYSHNRSHVRNHIESKHFPNTFSYDCPYENCGKVFNTCQAFQTHKSRVHKQWWTLYRSNNCFNEIDFPIWIDAPLFLFLIPGFELTDPSQLDQFIEKNAEGRMQCTICKDFSHNSRSHVRNHIESKHFPNTFSYDCPYENCGKIFYTFQAIQKHKSRDHKQWLTKFMYLIL